MKRSTSRLRAATPMPSATVNTFARSRDRSRSHEDDRHQPFWVLKLFNYTSSIKPAVSKHCRSGVIIKLSMRDKNEIPSCGPITNAAVAERPIRQHGEGRRYGRTGYVLRRFGSTRIRNICRVRSRPTYILPDSKSASDLSVLHRSEDDECQRSTVHSKSVTGVEGHPASMAKL